MRTWADVGLAYKPGELQKILDKSQNDLSYTLLIIRSVLA